jgi:methionyl-tRNA synthetase
VNIASRCAGFLTKGYDGAPRARCPIGPSSPRAHRPARASPRPTRARLRAPCARSILADHANQYIDERKPWQLVKDAAARDQVQAVCTQGLNLFRTLLVYLKPVLPALAERAEAFLACGPLRWQDAAVPQIGTRIAPFQPLLARVDPLRVQAILAQPDPAAGRGV